MNNRREIFVALGARALAFVAPLGAISQRQCKVWRIHFLAFRQQSLLLRAEEAIQ